MSGGISLVLWAALAGGASDVVLVEFTDPRCQPCQAMQPVVERLNSAINQALKDAEVRKRFSASAIEVVGGTPEEFGRYVRAEIKRWGEVARAANIQLD